MRSLRASPVFSLVVLVALALFVLIGLMLFGGFLGVEAIAAMGHFGSISHRIHDLTYSFLFGVAVVGLLAQLRTPTKNVAGQLMVLIPWAAFVLAYALGGILINLLRPPFVPIFGGLALLAAMLHPTWRDLFSSFSVSRVNRTMLVLVIMAAVPLLVFASNNIGLQRTATDAHAAQSHYAYMAAFSFTVIGVGLLASLRPDGWWLPAWVAGLLPALLGIASLVYPDASSSFSLGWALAAIAWGVVFVAAAELTQDAENPTLLGSRGIIPMLRGSGRVISEEDTRVRRDHGPTTSTPRGMKVFGVIALVPVLLVVANMVTGVFSGTVTHGPGGGFQHGPAGGGDASSIAESPTVEPATSAPTATPDVAFTLLPIIHIGAFVEASDTSGANPNPTLRVPLGSVVQVNLQNHMGGEFDIYFPDFEAKSERVAGGSKASIVFVADEAGEFVYYSTVPGHREAGLEGRIVVSE
ncbi:MAG: cupredoxin domain-containing protein [Chloroflexi bacterium]|nr:cupredoxin domain-containing protein [Chloroflexota bacterium]